METTLSEGYLPITIPRGMTEAEVVGCFAAYLGGCLAFDHPNTVKPFEKEPHNWSADSSNNYFIHFDTPTGAKISCRYESQTPVMRAMVELFHTRYVK